MEASAPSLPRIPYSRIPLFSGGARALAFRDGDRFQQNIDAGPRADGHFAAGGAGRRVRAGGHGRARVRAGVIAAAARPLPDALPRREPAPAKHPRARLRHVVPKQDDRPPPAGRDPGTRHGQASTPSTCCRCAAQPRRAVDAAIDHDRQIRARALEPVDALVVERRNFAVLLRRQALAATPCAHAR